MKKLILSLGFLIGLFATPALAANCSSYPFILTNGQTADANQVMANFNSILGCGNNNLAHSGANSDITSLSGLTTPLSILQGGTGNTTGTATTATTATTAGKWTTTRTESFTGDVTGGPTNVDGSANWSTAMALPTVNSNVGSFTYSSITVNAKGQVTAASNGTNPLNASNISSGVLGSNFGGAGAVTGALKANGSGVVSVAACADLSNDGTACTLNVGQTAGTVAAGDDSRFGGPTQNAQTTSYTLVLADAGKEIIHFTGSGNTITIPANASVPFPAGTKIEIVNIVGTGALSLAISTDTLIWVPSNATGTRSLASGAMVTITKISSNTWYLTGVGIT